MYLLETQGRRGGEKGGGGGKCGRRTRMGREESFCCPNSPRFAMIILVLSVLVFKMAGVGHPCVNCGYETSI